MNASICFICHSQKHVFKKKEKKKKVKKKKNGHCSLIHSWFKWDVTITYCLSSFHFGARNFLDNWNLQSRFGRHQMASLYEIVY